VTDSIPLHVATLQHMTGPGSRDQRAEYLARVEAAEGKEVADAVREAFAREWYSTHRVQREK